MFLTPPVALLIWFRNSFILSAGFIVIRAIELRLVPKTEFNVAAFFAPSENLSKDFVISSIFEMAKPVTPA